MVCKIRKYLFIFSCESLALASGRVIHNTLIHANRIVHKTGALADNTSLESINYLAGIKSDATVLVYDESNLDCLLINFIGSKPTFDCAGGAPGDR